MSKSVAKVAVDNTFFSFDTDYSYKIPTDFQDKIEIGSKVSVPFGRGNKLRDGIVIGFENIDDDSLKYIESVGNKIISDELDRGIEPLIPELLIPNNSCPDFSLPSTVKRI